MFSIKRKFALQMLTRLLANICLEKIAYILDLNLSRMFSVKEKLCIVQNFEVI